MPKTTTAKRATASIRTESTKQLELSLAAERQFIRDLEPMLLKIEAEILAMHEDYKRIIAKLELQRHAARSKLQHHRNMAHTLREETAKKDIFLAELHHTLIGAEEKIRHLEGIQTRSITQTSSAEELDTLRKRLTTNEDQHTVEIAQREHHIHELHELIAQLHGELQHLRDHNEALLNSTIWKMTAPLRRMVTWLRGTRGTTSE